MFWAIFYWIVAFVFIIGGFAILFFDWLPSPADTAWVAFFAAWMAAHSRARQES